MEADEKPEPSPEEISGAMTEVLVTALPALQQLGESDPGPYGRYVKGKEMVVLTAAGRRLREATIRRTTEAVTALDHLLAEVCHGDTPYFAHEVRRYGAIVATALAGVPEELPDDLLSTSEVAYGLARIGEDLQKRLAEEAGEEAEDEADDEATVARTAPARKDQAAHKGLNPMSLAEAVRLVGNAARRMKGAADAVIASKGADEEMVNMLEDRACDLAALMWRIESDTLHSDELDFRMMDGRYEPHMRVLPVLLLAMQRKPQDAPVIEGSEPDHVLTHDPAWSWCAGLADRIANSLFDWVEDMEALGAKGAQPETAPA